jgi:mono/diheme cytochrome c family protein
VDLRPLFVSGLLACLILLAAGCGGGDEDTIPNQSADAQAIRAKVLVEMEKDRLGRLAPRLERAVAAASKNLPTPPAGAAPAAAEGEEKVVRPAAELYAQNCASCHGASGKGDGPLSAGLNPQPAQHADGSYMNALSNDHIFKVVKEGGAAIGKSAMMAPWGSSISDEEIRGIVGFIRGLAEPAYAGEMP